MVCLDRTIDRMLAVNSPCVSNCSVAEQNSVDLAWQVLMEDEFLDLRDCIFTDLNELHRFRALLVNSVIATDIFDKEQGAIRKNRWTKAFDTDRSDAETAEDVNRKATIVIEHLIQASDVAHTMQHWDGRSPFGNSFARELLSNSLQILTSYLPRLQKLVTQCIKHGTNVFFWNCVQPIVLEGSIHVHRKDGIREKFGSLTIISSHWQRNLTRAASLVYQLMNS